ncbi:hypothetical protein [Phenylobacterium montanum]|uniref:Uncharacterized protein n=1 Tax=Phenylobacterium montanum TaxID=2823693 RepID=A0A975G124_9CAUL|nr:hypothetical protein [Caulobacter sp. S6]QUD88527.1 hypothetical protein KCG34_01130 [Caulobacter sp. S6]
MALQDARISWPALLLVPLLTSAIFVAILAVFHVDGARGGPLLIFLVLMAPACVVAYGATLFLFLPSLLLLSRLVRMTGLRACLLGFVLGAVVIVPLVAMAWKSSGPDSGPPTENFLVFFVRWAADPMIALFPFAGMTTAGLYWWLGKLWTVPRQPA